MATLNVEYAGICALCVSATSTSSVLLVDVAVTGRSKHSPSLLMSAHDLSSASAADFVTSVPGSDVHYAVWSLDGCEVSFDTLEAAGPPAHKFGTIGPREDPTHQDLSDLAWLLDLGEICGSNVLHDTPPVSTRVYLNGGTLETLWTPGAHEFLYELKDGDKVVVPTRHAASRFRHTMSFTDLAVVRITRSSGERRTINVATDASLLIGNLCDCPTHGGDHFYSYYELLDAPTRRPTIASVTMGGAIQPDQPEICVPVVLRVP